MKGMCHMTQTVRERLSAPVSERALETILGVALALWTFGEILFEHSTFAQTFWCVANRPVQYVQALVVGCLVAALASKRFRLGARDVALMFPLLFFALLVWGKSRDPHTLVLALFVVCVQGMDLRRLARMYAAGVVCALVITLAVTGWVYTKDPAFSLKNLVFGRYMFGYFGALSCLVLGLASALSVVVRGRRARVALALACVAFAAVSAVPLHSKRCALFLLLLSAIIAIELRWPERLEAALSNRWARWGVALLPAALFCLVSDMRMLYGAGFGMGAYANMPKAWGLGFSLSAAVLFAFAIVGKPGRKVQPIVLAVAVLYALLFVFEQLPMNLEFNFGLMVLALGLYQGEPANESAVDESEADKAESR